MVMVLLVVVVAVVVVTAGPVVGIGAVDVIVVALMIVHRGGDGGGGGRWHYSAEIQAIVQSDHRNTWQGLLSIVGIPGRCRLRAPVRIGRRALQRRVLWHEVDRCILAHSGRDLRLGTLASGIVFDLDRWRGRRWIDCFVFGPCLLHHDTTVELFECNLSRRSVNNENAIFSRVVSLIALEDGIWHTGTIQVRHGNGDLLVVTDFQFRRFVHVDAGGFEIIFYRVVHIRRCGIGEGRTEFQLAHF